MTDNDKLFLTNLSRVSAHNSNNPNEQKSMKVAKRLLSEDLLKLFEVDRNDQGAFMFNVYVEFEPLFRETKAKEWQTR